MTFGMTVSAAILVIGTASAAAAQDVRVRVDVRVPVVAGRDIARGVTSAVAGDVAADIRRTVSDVIEHLTDVRHDARQPQRDFRAEQTDHETRTLALGADGALDLRNVVGDISVTAGTGRDTTVEIVRTSRGRTDADARLGLSRIKVEVDQRGNRATIRPLYPDESRPPYSVSVSYRVTAPAGTRVTATSLSGGVTIHGIRGDVAVSVTSGNVDLGDLGRISTAKAISGDITITGADMADSNLVVGTMSGNLTLQRVKARRLEGSTISGTVTARDIAVDSATLTSMNGAVSYAGTLARSGRYELQTHSGPVHFTPTGSTGFELQANTFSGDIRTDVPLQMQSGMGTRGPRRMIRATTGDASAVVILTTFSGSIVIGK
jgi:hypothetical protein